MRSGAFILSVLLEGVTAAQPAAPWLDAVAAADTDGDGRVSRQEVKQFAHTARFAGFQPFLADHFLDFDSDGDGTLTVEELRIGIMRLGMGDEEVAQGFRAGFQP